MVFFEKIRLLPLIIFGVVFFGVFFSPARADKVGPLVLVPSFTACSVYLDLESLPKTHLAEFRKKGEGEWQRAYPLVVTPGKNQLRGSIVNLAEDTAYEVRVTFNQSTQFKGGFTTWNTTVPVGRTIELNDTPTEGIVISESGSPTGWLRVTTKPGVILKGDGAREALIQIWKARYVILENLVIEGGRRHGISVLNSQYIRIVNCDISGYGRIGQQDLTKDGKFYTAKGKAINYDAGVEILNSGHLVVERCYIHDPRSRANAWKFSHPAGPNAVAVKATGNVVLRYNDFIGSDKHRWNDCVEGHANGHMEGSLCRDSDVYGNFMIFGNDDGIELDGGQSNIRVFKNKFEGFLCGVSTAPCLAGPSYIYQNIISRLGDEDGKANCAFKNGHGKYGLGQIFFFNNTVVTAAGGGYGNYGGFEQMPHPADGRLKGVTRNNLLYCPTGHFNTGINLKRKNDFDYDLMVSDEPKETQALKPILLGKGLEPNGLFGKKPVFRNREAGDYALHPGSPGISRGQVVDNFIPATGQGVTIGAVPFADAPMNIPYRPIPVYLDKQQLNFFVAAEKPTEDQLVTATIIQRVAGAAYSSPFTIKKNRVFNWFSVDPPMGVIASGRPVPLRVKLIPGNMPSAGVYRGAFLLRLPNGFSRAVTVYATVKGGNNLTKPGSGYLQTLEAEMPEDQLRFPTLGDADASGGRSLYLEAKYPTQLKGALQTYHFDLPKDGDYMIFVRVRSALPVGSHDSIFASVDEAPAKPSHLRSAAAWTWSNVSVNPKNPYFQLLKLKRGRHRLRLYPRESISIDMIAVTDNVDRIY